MLGWFLRRLGLRAGRAVFRYWDGSARRVGDPVYLERALRQRAGERWPTLVELVHKASLDPAKHSGPVVAMARQKGEEAFVSLVDVVRHVFGVKPIDQGGLTEAECLDLLAEFVVTVGRLVEAARPFSRPAWSGPPSDAPAPTSGPDSLSSSNTAGTETNSPAPLPRASDSLSPASASEG